MSTELKVVRKKRTSSGVSSYKPVREGDHRKRRRNRTTQSCLNCHTSKRMCDRKRPCGRCTQLGLTGLCVYEIDDPSQRSDAQDESSRLRERVAELEGVIRELKNRPHPRWAKPGSSPSEEFEKCHAQAQSRCDSECSAVEHQHQPAASQSLNDSNPESNKETLNEQTLPLLGDTIHAEIFSSSFSPLSTGSAPLSTSPFSPFLSIQSPSSTASTGVVTPMKEHPQLPIAVAGDRLLDNDIDLASLLMLYSDILPRDDGSTGQVGHMFEANSHGQRVDSRFMKYDHGRLLDGHCGCLNEVAGYNVILELSLRLRKAADVLSHVANHRFNSVCPLNQRVVDLDAFATTVLGNITTSPNDLELMYLRSRASGELGGSIPAAMRSQNRYVPTLRTPTVPLGGFRSWNVVPCCASDPHASCDDPFTTWEPSRQN